MIMTIQRYKDTMMQRYKDKKIQEKKDARQFADSITCQLPVK